MGSALGIADEKLLALPAYESSALFDERERVALRYADAMTLSDRDVSDALFADARAHFDDDALVELTAVIAWENASSKFNRALRIPSQNLYTGSRWSADAAGERPAPVPYYSRADLMALYGEPAIEDNFPLTPEIASSGPMKTIDFENIPPSPPPQPGVGRWMMWRPVAGEAPTAVTADAGTDIWYLTNAGGADAAGDP